MRFDVVAVGDSVHVHISRAQEPLLVCCEVILAHAFVVHEIAVGTFADACLRRRTTVEWHERVGAFGEIEERQIRLRPDFAVLSALIAVRIAWHEQPVEVTFALSFKYIFNYISSSGLFIFFFSLTIITGKAERYQKDEEEQQADDISARSFGEGASELRIVVELLSCWTKNKANQSSGQIDGTSNKLFDTTVSSSSALPLEFILKTTLLGNCFQH